MKHIKTIVPTTKGPFFTSCPDPHVKRIEVFKDEHKADRIEVRFTVNPKSKEQLYQQLLDGLSSGCSATEGAEVPTVSPSKARTSPPDTSTPQEPLLAKTDDTSAEISIQGYDFSVLSALRDSFDVHHFPLRREYLNEISQAVLSEPTSNVSAKPIDKQSCTIL